MKKMLKPITLLILCIAIASLLCVQVLAVSARDELAKYCKILYLNARLVSGLSVDNSSELQSLVCDLMLK